MKKALFATLIGLVAALPAAGCNRGGEPIKCVCDCDNPPPDGAKVTIKEAGTPAPAVAQAPQAPQAPAAPSAAAAPAQRATGQVSAEPGSGAPTQLSDADKEEMVKVMTEFSNAAGARNVEGMKKWTTQRLGSSLDDAVKTHTERLYRRTDMFTKGVQAGVTVGQANDNGDGNFDVEFKFGDGEAARLLMFKEDGAWRLNRL